jgi:hypothetical protein
LSGCFIANCAHFSTEKSPIDANIDANREPQMWLLKHFNTETDGLQSDGSVIICSENEDLEKAMTGPIEQLQSFFGDEFQIEYDVRILKSTSDKLNVCVKGHKIEPDQEKQEDLDQIVELVPSEKLFVNTEEQHYIIKKSMQNGEHDLYELCKKSNKEENFVFMKFKDGTQQWLECGIKETSETASIDLKPIKKIVGENETKIESLAFYHHHPVDKEANNDSSQTPSGKDIEGFVKILEMIDVLYPSLSSKLDFRIITSSGKYRFKLDRKILDSPRQKFSVLNAATAIEEERRRSHAYFYSNRMHFSQENVKFAKKFSSKYMKIDFFPDFQQPKTKIKTTRAQPTGLFILSTDRVRYEVFFNPSLMQLILRHPSDPVLYDEKGYRIGYIGPDGEFIFATPPEGWPDKYKAKIELVIYKQVEDKLMKIKFFNGRFLDKT